MEESFDSLSLELVGAAFLVDLEAGLGLERASKMEGCFTSVTHKHKEMLRLDTLVNLVGCTFETQPQSQIALYELLSQLRLQSNSTYNLFLNTFPCARHKT